MVPVAQEMESLRKERDQLLLRLQQLEQDGQARAILALVFLGAFLLLSFLIFSAWSCCFFNAWKWRFHGLRWDLPGIRSWARWISEAGGGLERTATDADGWWVDGSMTNGRWGCWRSALPMNEFTIFQFLGDRLGHSSIGSSFNPPKMGNRSYVYIIVLWDRQM